MKSCKLETAKLVHRFNSKREPEQKYQLNLILRYKKNGLQEEALSLFTT